MLQKNLLLSVCLTIIISTVSTAQETASFAVVKKGAGKQNVILVPGLGCSSSVWNQTIEALSPDATCYAISFAGFAGNKPQSNADMDKWENDIVKYIQDGRIDNAVLIGHSMGGKMALAIASAHPHLFSKVVIVDAFPCLSALYNPAFKSQVHIDVSPFIDHFTKMDSADFINMAKLMLADTSRLPTLVDWLMKSDRRTMGQMYGTLLNKDSRTKVSNIQCPVLVMLQPAMKAKEAEIKGQYAPVKNVTIKFATKGLHFVMYDDKEWYLSTLQSFLQ